MPVFLAEAIRPDGIKLSGEDVHHITRVLRMKAGDLLQVVDGKGRLMQCRILETEQENLRLEIISERPGHLDPGYRLHMAVAPTKSMDRFEWFLEKATEIGITEITPLICERSERRRIRPERQQKIIRTALKQSGRAILPVLHEASNFQEFIRKVKGDRKYIAHCGAGKDQTFPSPSQGSINWIILIGPEGDFTDHELASARSNRYQDLHLGPATYRTETAAVMACHALSLQYR